MLLALATLARILSACWRPDPYTPPPAPAGEDPVEERDPEGEADGEADGEGSVEEEGAADAEVAGEGQGAGEAGADDAEGGDEVGSDAEDEADAPPFAIWRARTTSAPVTLVDDWGKPLAVLGKAQWELEVRGEEAIRTRVWCGTCSPAVEGWIQAHLLERVP